MRWLPQTSLLILLMAWPAAAQAQFPLPPRPRPQPEDTPKFELAPVYSINVVPTEQLSRIGASVSFAWNVSPEDGLFLDVGGYRLPATPQQQRLLTYMAGYRRSARNSRYVNLFVQGALGGAHLSANGGIITQSQRLTAASAGVGADIRISQDVWLRLVQADFIFAFNRTTSITTLRASSGIVFRFGGK